MVTHPTQSIEPLRRSKNLADIVGPLTISSPASPPAGARSILTVISVEMVLGLLLASYRLRNLRRKLRQAQHQAHYDELTGLPNRRAALTHLNTRPVAMVALLDVDRFKEVNDRFGHHVGDQLLRTLATRLRQALTGRAVAARLAGDEFVVLWATRPDDPVAEAKRLQRHLTQPPMRIDGHLVQPQVSIGLALAGAHLHGEHLLVAADHTMYEAKNQGIDSQMDRTGVHLYGPTTPPAPIDRALPRRSARHP